MIEKIYHLSIAGCPWEKSSMHFFHSVDRWKSRGFPQSTGIASSDAALYSQPANAPAIGAVHLRAVPES